MEYVYLYFIVLIQLLIFDLIWFSFMLEPFYRKKLEDKLALKPKILPGAFFYLIYSLGVILFVLVPAIEKNETYMTTAFWGGAFAFVSYSTFHFTNKSILKDWPYSVILVDVLFGVFITAFMSASTLIAYNIILKSPFN